MADRYVTLMLIPSRNGRVRKLTLPSMYLKIGAGIFFALLGVGLWIFVDYLDVVSQVAENKKLRVENQNLRNDITAARNRLDSLDQSLDRLKSFAQKLKVLGNLESPSSTQLLRTPTPERPQTPGMAPTQSYPDEDSGVIEDPDRQGSMRLPSDPIFDSNPGTSATISGGTVADRVRIRGELDRAFEGDDLPRQIEALARAAQDLKQVADLEEQSFAELQELFSDRVDRLLRTPSIVPSRGYISSEFGYRSNPFTGRRTFHAGLDIANHIGTQIYAPAEGLVTFAGTLGGFGMVVRIDHGYNVVTKYGHNSKVLVKKGDRVKRGDVIAEMGNSGRSTGPHLHYQIEVAGKPVNPRFFMLEELF